MRCDWIVKRIWKMVTENMDDTLVTFLWRSSIVIERRGGGNRQIKMPWQHFLCCFVFEIQIQWNQQFHKKCENPKIIFLFSSGKKKSIFYFLFKKIISIGQFPLLNTLINPTLKLIFIWVIPGLFSSIQYIWK